MKTVVSNTTPSMCNKQCISRLRPLIWELKENIPSVFLYAVRENVMMLIAKHWTKPHGPRLMVVPNSDNRCHLAKRSDWSRRVSCQIKYCPYYYYYYCAIIMFMMQKNCYLFVQETRSSFSVIYVRYNWFSFLQERKCTHDITTLLTYCLICTTRLIFMKRDTNVTLFEARPT